MVDKLQGRFLKDDTMLLGSDFLLETPQSRLAFDFSLPMDWCDNSKENHLKGEVHLSLQELATILGVHDDRFDYSDWGPITCNVSVGGSSQQMEIQDVYIELANSFIMTAAGALQNVCSDQRSGQLDILGDLYDLSCFNSWLSEDNSISIPPKMVLQGFTAVDGDKYVAELVLKDAGGVVDVKAMYNSTSEAYSVKGKIDSLFLNRFLPNEPLENLSLDLIAQGRGFDFYSKQSSSAIKANLSHLKYGEYLVDNVNLDASLKQGRLVTTVTSDNALLKGLIDGYYDVNTPDLSLNYNLNIDHIDLYELRILKRRLKEDVKIEAGIQTDADSISLVLNSGDFNFKFGAKRSVNDLLNKSNEPHE